MPLIVGLQETELTGAGVSRVEQWAGHTDAAGYIDAAKKKADAAAEEVKSNQETEESAETQQELWP